MWSDIGSPIDQVWQHWKKAAYLTWSDLSHKSDGGSFEVEYDCRRRTAEYCCWKKWLFCSQKQQQYFALTTRAINRAIKWEGKTDQLEGGKWGNCTLYRVWVGRDTSWTDRGQRKCNIILTREIILFLQEFHLPKTYVRALNFNSHSWKEVTVDATIRGFSPQRTCKLLWMPLFGK